VVFTQGIRTTAGSKVLADLYPTMTRPLWSTCARPAPSCLASST
jgi:hypothetical protein